MADAQPKTGAQMCLYYSTDMDSLEGVNVLIDVVDDVNLSSFSREMVELAFRGCEYKMNMAGLMEAPEADFKLIHNLNPEIEDALTEAQINATPIMLKIMNGDITATGTKGLAMPVLISEMPWSQELSGVSARDIKCVFTYVKNGGEVVKPQWITIS